MACTDSPLEDWEPYLPTSQQPVSTFSVDKTSVTVGATSAKESIIITSTDSFKLVAQFIIKIMLFSNFYLPIEIIKTINYEYNNQDVIYEQEK